MTTIPLSVMTFNLRYGTAKDGDNIWENRKALVVETIAKYQPTLLGVQEGLLFQLQTITEELPAYQRFGVSRQGNTEDEHNAIFYDASHVELQESGDFWLSETPDIPGSQSWDSSHARMVTWGRFRMEGTNQALYHFNTHFDHRGEVARQQSALMVWERLETIATDIPVFLTGDFNTVRGQPSWNFLVGQESLAGKRGNLVDAWLEAPTRSGGATMTYHGFNGLDTEKARWQDGRWGHEDSHIDWILCRPGIHVKRAVVVTDNQNGGYPSDHYPVYAEFELARI